LAVCDLNEAGLEETAAAIRSLGRRALARRVDVARAEEVRAFADAVHAEHEAVDVLINNAGVGLGGGFLDTSLEDWQWILSINLWGVIHGCQFFLPPMVRRGRGGHVVNVSSAAGFLATAQLAAYSATKFAVFGLSEALRDELRPHGIAVTTVCPGIINTPITTSAPMRGPLATPEARAALVELYRRRNYGPERVAQQLPLHARRVGPRRGHADPDEVPRERRGGPEERRERLAARARQREAPAREPPRLREPPVRRRRVQELLQRDGLVVAQVVDARDVLALDGRHRGGVEVGEREQVLPRRPPPHGQQAVAEEPARRLDHLDPAGVDGADAQDDGHHGRSVTGREQALLRQEPRARVDRAGGAVHASHGGPLGRRFALDVREAHQHELAHAGRPGRREQVLHEADVRPPQGRLRAGGEEGCRGGGGA